MARTLVLVPPGSVRIVGATPIGPDYPRTATPEEMRGWAADFKRLQVRAASGRSAPLADLAEDEQRRLRVAHHHLLGEPSRGIRGTLRDDGAIELDAGRHRAAYLLERGDVAVPVWVSSAEPSRLADLQRTCDDFPRERRARNRNADTRDRAQP